MKDLIEPKNWGEYQQACHKMLKEYFPTTKEAYKWLNKEFGNNFHFQKLNYPTDLEKLKEIHQKLWLYSFSSDN